VSETYWLDVCDGREAAIAYIEASGEDVIAALERYPILMLPAFPAAIAALGAAAATQELQATFADNARALGAAQQTLREGLASAYAALMSQLAVMLAEEPRGDRRMNLEQAAEAFHAAGAALPAGPEYASTLFDEATSWWHLAELGADPQENMERAAALYAEARAAFGDGPSAGQCAVSEAKARTLLAENGIDSLANFDAAAQLYMSAHGMFDDGDPRGTSCVVGAAHALARLEELRGAGADGP
jgi:hypothetical protein